MIFLPDAAVKCGGGYIGTCAGLANTINNNERLRLLPFRLRRVIFQKGR